MDDLNALNASKDPRGPKTTLSGLAAGCSLIGIGCTMVGNADYLTGGLLCLAGAAVGYLGYITHS